jgi:hypothetical protein
MLFSAMRFAAKLKRHPFELTPWSRGARVLCKVQTQDGIAGVNTVAFVYDFDPIYQILRSTFSGHVSDETLLDHQRVGALLVASLDPRFAIIDLSASDPFAVTVAGVRALAKLPPPMPKRDRPRVVIAPSDHMFGMARIFEIEGETTRPSLHVVRSVRDAWAILGVEMKEAKFEPISRADFAH